MVKSDNLLLSVIIPTCNKLPRLKLTLASLKQQTLLSRSQIIIVENGSTDETQEYLQGLSVHFPAQIICTDRAGRAKARNIGAKHAKAPYLLFIDDDVLFRPDFLENHIQCHMKRPCIVHGMIRDIPILTWFSDPEKGILENSTAISESRKTWVDSKRIKQSDIIINFEQAIASQSKLFEFESIIQAAFAKPEFAHLQWLSFTGGNVSLPRSWFESKDGFDESYGLNWGCEDLDMGYRLKEYPFYYSTLCVNYHMTHSRKNHIDEHRKNTLIFFQKYHDPVILLLQKYICGQLKKKELENQLFHAE